LTFGGQSKESGDRTGARVNLKFQPTTQNASSLRQTGYRKMASRREKLEVMLQSSPDDQMLRYMLAMEFDKEGNSERSLELFDGLMTATSPYVPAFLMAGQLLTRIGKVEDARKTFSAGIQQAQQQNNSHAAGEMAGFLAGLS
jgi:predicted Zn-dependent protease